MTYSAFTREEVLALSQTFNNLAEGLEAVGSAIRTNQMPPLSYLSEALKEIIKQGKAKPDAVLCMARLFRHASPVYQHAVRLTGWALVIGHKTDLTDQQTEQLVLAVLLTGLGKSHLPDEQLTQFTPLKLSAQTCKHLDHTLRDAYKIKGLNKEVIGVIEHYCERIDGSGYPSAKPNKSLPVLSQYAGLIETYELLVHPFNAKNALLPNEAIMQIQLMGTSQFDGQYVGSFVKALGRYPAGTFAEFDDNSIGMILGASALNPASCFVAMLTEPNKVPLRKFPHLDMADSAFALKIRKVMSAREITADLLKLGHSSLHASGGWLKRFW